MTQVEWKDLAHGQAWATKQLKELKRPCVVLICGEMGAGKTQLVRWWVEALGGSAVASPTFAIHHQYSTPQGPIDHVDLYRLTSDADLESSGFWDLFENDHGLVFVEWADRLPDSVWPAAWTKIKVQIAKVPGQGDLVRRVQIQNL